MPARANRRSIALNRIYDCARELRAKAIVVGSCKVSAQVLVGRTLCEISTQQPLNGVRNLVSSGPVAQRASRPGEPPHSSPHAEVKSVHQLPILLDLLALKSDISDPVLTATIGATGHVQLDLLVETWQPLLHLAHQPLRETFGLGNGQLAKLSAGAGDRSAPEGRHIDLQLHAVQSNHQVRSFRI